MSQAVLQLQEACPNARVVYASATGLQSLESMAYASRCVSRPFARFFPLAVMA